MTKRGQVGVKNYDMILMRRLLVKGFICLDHADQMPNMLDMVKKGVRASVLCDAHSQRLPRSLLGLQLHYCTMVLP